MANTLSGTYVANVANLGLAALSKRLMGLNVFTTDFSGDVVQGNVVTTRIIPAATAPVDKSTTAYNDSTVIPGVTTTAVNITLNQHKVNGFNITDKELSYMQAGVVRDTKDKLIEKHVNGIADTLLGYVFDLITVANFSSAHTAVAAAAFDYADCADMRTTLAKAHWPIMDAAMVLNPDYIGALLKDTAVAYQYSSGLSAITDGAGAVKRIAGLALHEAATLDENSENLVGFTCLKDAICVAMRAPRSTEQLPPGAYYETVTDPQTGATLGLYVWFDATQRQWVWNFEAQYGASVGVAAHLYRIVKA